MAVRGRKGTKTYAPPAYPLAHPEIFYRLQPEILLECDALQSVPATQITPELVNQSVDKIRDGVSRKYPDLALAARDYEKNVASAAEEPIELFGVRIERRGAFSDLIAFLLLAELFRRRRFFRR